MTDILDVLWDIFLLVLPVGAGYLLNVFRKHLRNRTIKKLLRFKLDSSDKADIRFITANTGQYDGEEMVTLGYIFEYMSVGEIKAFFSKIFAPNPQMTTTMSLERFTDIKRKDIKQNLVLIGGPFHNSVTGALLNKMENCPFRYDLTDATLIFTTPSGEEVRYTPKMYDPSAESGMRSYFENDYCLVMNVKNPLDSSKRIILISGCRSVGCYGGAVFLSSQLTQAKKLVQSDEYALIIQCDGEREDLVSTPQLCACYPLDIRYKP